MGLYLLKVIHSQLPPSILLSFLCNRIAVEAPKGPAHRLGVLLTFPKNLFYYWPFYTCWYCFKVYEKNLTLEGCFFPFLVRDSTFKSSYVFSMSVTFKLHPVAVFGIILPHSVPSRVWFVSFWSSFLMILHHSSAVGSKRRSAAPEHHSTHVKIGVKVEIIPIQSHTGLLKTGRHLNLHKKDKYLCWC